MFPPACWNRNGDTAGRVPGPMCPSCLRGHRTWAGSSPGMTTMACITAMPPTTQQRSIRSSWSPSSTGWTSSAPAKSSSASTRRSASLRHRRAIRGGERSLCRGLPCRPDQRHHPGRSRTTPTTPSPVSRCASWAPRSNPSRSNSLSPTIPATTAGEPLKLAIDAGFSSVPPDPSNRPPIRSPITSRLQPAGFSALRQACSLR